MVVRVKWFYHPEEAEGCPNLKYPVSFEGWLFFESYFWRRFLSVLRVLCSSRRTRTKTTCRPSRTSVRCSRSRSTRPSSGPTRASTVPSTTTTTRTTWPGTTTRPSWRSGCSRTLRCCPEVSDGLRRTKRGRGRGIRSGAIFGKKIISRQFKDLSKILVELGWGSLQKISVAKKITWKQIS